MARRCYSSASETTLTSNEEIFMRLRNLDEFANVYKMHKEQNKSFPLSITICPALQHKRPKMSKEDAIVMQEALTSGLCPQNFVLKIDSIELQNIGAGAIGNALLTGKLPNGFKLILTRLIAKSNKKLTAKANQQYFHEKTTELLQPIADSLMFINGSKIIYSILNRRIPCVCNRLFRKTSIFLEEKFKIKNKVLTLASSILCFSIKAKHIIHQS